MVVVLEFTHNQRNSISSKIGWVYYNGV